jgi:hypothetical protein
LLSRGKGSGACKKGKSNNSLHGWVRITVTS